MALIKKPKLDKEAVGSNGINIATDVIFEEQIDFLRNKGKDGYKYFFNIDTLIRNHIECLEGNSAYRAEVLSFDRNLNIIMDSVINEASIIISLLEQVGMDIVFYKLLHKKTRKVWKNKFYTISDLKGFRGMLLAAIDRIFELGKLKFTKFVEVYDYELPNRNNVIITTHTAPELLSFNNRPNVLLLESHTAEVKNNEKFYTKLKKFGKNNMSIVPFNELTLLIFGDAYLLKSESIRVKKHLYDDLKKKHLSHNIPSMRLITALKSIDFSIGPVLNNLYKPLYKK